MDYHVLLREIQSFAEEEPWYLSLLSNVSALLYEEMEDLNWAGFYVMRDGQLTLGPFQGKVACIHIRPGRGVCGTAVERDDTVRVADVHAFPGHIACDSASSSEIVVPIHADGQVVAVLDIDSPKKDRFDAEDQAGLEELVRVLEKVLVWQ